MNKYSSYLRTFRGRRLVEKAIAPPANFTIGLTDWNPVIFTRSFNLLTTFPATLLNAPMNIAGNITLKKIGVFSNFADGLVAKKVSVGLGAGGFNGLDINVRAASYTRAFVPATTISGDPSSRTMTVAGAGAGLDAGAAILMIGGGNQFAFPLWEYAFVESFVAPDLVLSDYPKYTYVAQPVYLLTAIAESRFFHMIDLNELNYLYNADHFFTPLQFSSANATDVIIWAQAMPNGTVEYFTKSIDPTYLNDIALFDAVAEFEFTNSSTIITP